MIHYEIYESLYYKGCYIVVLDNYCDMQEVQKKLLDEGYIIQKTDGIYIYCRKWEKEDD